MSFSGKERLRRSKEKSSDVQQRRTRWAIAPGHFVASPKGADNGPERAPEHYLVGQDTSSGIAVATGIRQFGYNLDMRELLFTCLIATSAFAQTGKFGSFTNSDDVGDPPLKGGAEFDASTGAVQDHWFRHRHLGQVGSVPLCLEGDVRQLRRHRDGEIPHRRNRTPKGCHHAPQESRRRFTVHPSRHPRRRHAHRFSSATPRPITPTPSIFR